MAVTTTRIHLPTRWVFLAASDAVGVMSGAGVAAGAVGAVMLKSRRAGEMSRLSPTSRDRTSMLCGPWLSAARVFGDVHGAHAPPSTRHWKLEPAWSEEKLNV